MYFSKSILLLSLVLSAASLATPHTYLPRHHRSIAARLAAPDVLPRNSSAQPVFHKRSLNKRCKPRKPPTPGASTSSAASATPTPAVVNAGSEPTSSTPDSPPTSTQKRPPPTTTQQQPPPPTTTQQRQPPPASAPPPPAHTEPSGDQPSYMTGTQTGDGTFYATGMGSCGVTSSDSDHIVAVSQLLYDTYPGYQGGNPNNNPVCGRKITASYQGKSVTVTVVDRCTGCSITSLDFSPAAFNQLADFSVGRIHDMTWVWA